MFMGLDQDKYDRQYDDKYIFNRLWAYIRPYKAKLAISLLMGLIISIALASIPIIIAAGVGALENNQEGNILTLLVGALLLAALGEYFGNLVFRRVNGRLIGDLVANMRKDAFASAVKRDLAFYDENKTGKVLSRITSDTEEFGQTMLFSSFIVSELVQLIILSGVLLWRDAFLTFLLVAFIIPIAITTVVFRHISRKATRQGSRAMAEVNDNIQETVTGISVAKTFRQERMIYDSFVKVNTQSYKINMQRGLVFAAIFPVLNALAGLAIASMLYFGAVAVVDGVIAVSIWFLYLQSVERFWFPLINLSSFWSQFQQALSALERILALIDTENTVKQRDKKTVDHLDGGISFQNITFAYKDGQPVLENFSLDIKPGENIAFVGHTGAGKSSITKLIMRFYEFQEGQILIDGQDIRSFDIQQYRAKLGFVPQQPFLFSGTIIDNIRYSRPDATDAEIEAVAHSIGNGEWLETLPEGLHSDVGERGARLSLGQRQLVSLLRVLIQQPAIFILDEATASIDSFTEAQIQEALDLILARSTSILIAHRLSTVRSADRIIVLRDGGIIEQGSHESLMAQNGHYAELYNTYFRHQSLDYVQNARQRFDVDGALLGATGD